MAEILGGDDMEINTVVGMAAGANSKLAELSNQVADIENGAPAGVFATTAALEADATANTADGKKRAYIVTADGKWYFWNSSAWTAGGIYQATGIADKSVSYGKTDFLTMNKNVLNEMWEVGGLDFTSGGTAASDVSTRSVDMVPVLPNTLYTFSYALLPKGTTYIFEYTSAGAFVQRTAQTFAFNHTTNRYNSSFTTTGTTGNIKVYMYKYISADYSPLKIQLEAGEGTSYIPYGVIPTNDFVVPVDSQVESIRNCKELDFSTSPTVYGFNKFLTADWENGAINTNGTNDPKNYRIRTAGYITPKDKLHVKLLDSSFMFAVRTFQANGTSVADSGWTYNDLEYDYTEGYKYRIIIARVTENTSEIATVAEFTAAIVIGEGIIKNNTINIMGIDRKYIGVTARIGSSIGNTVEAIKQASLGGAWGVEIDCRLTADNDVVLSHAALLSTTTDEIAGKYVYEYTLAEIKAFTILQSGTVYYDYDVKIPSLEEALDVCREYGIVPVLDIKYDQAYERTNKATLFNAVIAKLLAKDMIYTSVFVFEITKDVHYVRDNYPDTWIAYKHATSTTTIANALLAAKSIGRNVIMQPEVATTWVTDDAEAVETSAARLLAYHNAGFKVVGDEIIMTFGLIPAASMQRCHRYYATLSTVDNGANWTVPKYTVGQIVTVSAVTVNSHNCLGVTFSGIAPNEIDVLKPSIQIEDINNFAVDVRCYYDLALKQIVIGFFADGSQIDFAGLPASLSFRLSIIF